MRRRVKMKACGLSRCFTSPSGTDETRQLEKIGFRLIGENKITDKVYVSILTKETNNNNLHQNSNSATCINPLPFGLVSFDICRQVTLRCWLLPE